MLVASSSRVSDAAPYGDPPPTFPATTDDRPPGEPPEASYFADAEAPFDAARFVLFGYPYDGTACFRRGTARAPREIRRYSYNFETHLIELGIDLTDIPIHDWGDIASGGDGKGERDGIRCDGWGEGRAGGGPEAHHRAIGELVMRILAAKAFPVGLGGEHSLTPPVVRALAEHHAELGVVVLDAHLDYRDGYEGHHWSHAATVRRVADIVGPERVWVIGVRSASHDEVRTARADGLRYIETGWSDLREHLADVVDGLSGPLYLSLDMDAIDPAFAPGVGTPEPFGMTPYEVLQTINLLSDRLVGFDCVEVCPPADNGNTAAIAARLVRHLLGAVQRAQPREG